MTLPATQKSAIEEIINVLIATTAPRGKRRLAEMFMDLVDKDEWPEYYEVIPDPKCFNNIRSDLANNAYKDSHTVYNDIKLIFLNALHYNQEDSQIAKDANTLKGLLEMEWKQRTVLPAPRRQPSVNDRNITPDVDIDGGTSEPDVADNTSTNNTREAQSDAIVKQLEKGLRGWEGFADGGWSTNFGEERFHEILQAVERCKDSAGNLASGVLDAIPEVDTKHTFPFQQPLSLKSIEDRILARRYSSSQAFDREMHEFFLKARRWYDQGSDEYGNVLLLQRFYQALTSFNPPAGPPYQSTSNWASLPAGPGTAKPLNASDNEGSRGVTTFRVSTKDRRFIDEVVYRGWKIRVADWLHLSNPDDPSKPIVGQVFKCYASEEISKRGQLGITVCWYYRPEQTIHPAHRQFWEGEVFKTSHFADHPLDDVIEKIACQFTARHIRGRPRPPFWYPGFPLYVCDSRYNDRERIFVKIKNWNSCVPEEVRKSADFMPIYPFETSVFPRRFPSPFLSGGRGTGRIGEAVERGDGDKFEGGGTGRKRVRKAGNAGATSQTDYSGPSKGVYVGPPTTTAAATASFGVAINAPVATTSLQPYHVQSSAYHQQQRSTSSQPRFNEDRSILTAAGGLAALGAQNVFIERLPPETAKHFDRDPETNEVLWFSSPPVDIAPSVPALRHSFAYMHYLAKKKRKAGDMQSADRTRGLGSLDGGGVGGDDDGMMMDVDDSGSEDSGRNSSRSGRLQRRMTVGEMLDKAIAGVT